MKQEVPAPRAREADERGVEVASLAGLEVHVGSPTDDTRGHIVSREQKEMACGWGWWDWDGWART